MMNKATKLIAAAIVGGSVLLTAGCGRPSTDDIQKAIAKASNVAGIPTSLTSEQYKCIATAIHDSKLSDDALKALVDGKSTFKASDGDDAAMEALGEKISACR